LTEKIEPRIRLCMMSYPLFTAEMAARFGGSVPDIRRQLEDLHRRGVLGRDRGRTPDSRVFYYRLHGHAE
jgi:predicted ArsR family transcriptional regulator